jgi:SNF2 family DNA or RNA helicase
MLIVDESTTIKTPDVQRTKRTWQIAAYAKARFILSGTPITNSPLDIWAQAEALSPGIMGRNFFLFKQRYAVHEVVRISALRSVNKVTGYQNLEELTTKINKFAAIAKKSDCLDLPPKILRQVPVMFTPEQAHHYQQLKEFALTSIDNQEFTAVNAISLINLLLQVCAGQIKNPDGTYTELPTNRIDLLNDLIEENPDKPLIWCAFVGAGDAVERAFPTSLMRIKRETPNEERNNILELYAKTQDKLGLLVSQSLMGRGHTILEGRNMIYYAQRFSVEQRVQSEDRPHRIGQDRTVLVSELFTPDTVEVKVLKVLQEGQALANKVIRDKSTFREFIS